MSTAENELKKKDSNKNDKKENFQPVTNDQLEEAAVDIILVLKKRGLNAKDQLDLLEQIKKIISNQKDLESRSLLIEFSKIIKETDQEIREVIGQEHPGIDPKSKKRRIKRKKSLFMKILEMMGIIKQQQNQDLSKSKVQKQKDDGPSGLEKDLDRTIIRLNSDFNLSDMSHENMLQDAASMSRVLQNLKIKAGGPFSRKVSPRIQALFERAANTLANQFSVTDKNEGIGMITIEKSQFENKISNEALNSEVKLKNMVSSFTSGSGAIISSASANSSIIPPASPVTKEAILNKEKENAAFAASSISKES